MQVSLHQVYGNRLKQQLKSPKCLGPAQFMLKKRF